MVFEFLITNYLFVSTLKTFSFVADTEVHTTTDPNRSKHQEGLLVAQITSVCLSSGRGWHPCPTLVWRKSTIDWGTFPSRERGSWIGEIAWRAEDHALTIRLLPVTLGEFIARADRTLVPESVKMLDDCVTCTTFEKWLKFIRNSRRWMRMCCLCTSTNLIKFIGMWSYLMHVQEL